MSRKRCNRRHYALVNPIQMAMEGAAITPSSLLDKLRIRELSAIEAFRTGKATKQEWRDLADMLNISETLINDGIGPEAAESCQMAQEALGAAHARFRTHGKLGFTGPEFQAMRDAYEYADLQRLSISRSRYEQAIKKTGDRIRSAHPSLKVCMA